MAKPPRKPEAKEAGDLFDAVIGACAGDRGVTQSRMFGSAGLKVKNKVFAMLVKGKLVVKLPRERVEALVSAKRGVHFDPGHGRVMKEWVAVGPVAKKEWIGLAAEAKDFVASSR